MFFLVRCANIILEEDVGRGRTLGCIRVLELPFTLLLLGKTTLADVKRGKLALTRRRFRDHRVQKLREIVNGCFIDGHFGDGFGKHVSKSTELTRRIVELDGELDRRTREELADGEGEVV